jgi:hypothetical protein
MLDVRHSRRQSRRGPFYREWLRPQGFADAVNVVLANRGLTRATLGLEHVRPGGDRDPAMTRPGRRRFRWLTTGMLAAFVGGLLGLGVLLVMLAS